MNNWVECSVKPDALVEEYLVFVDDGYSAPRRTMALWIAEKGWSENSVTHWQELPDEPS